MGAVGVWSVSGFVLAWFGSGGDICFGHVGNFACGLPPVQVLDPSAL